MKRVCKKRIKHEKCFEKFRRRFPNWKQNRSNNLGPNDVLRLTMFLSKRISWLTEQFPNKIDFPKIQIINKPFPEFYFKIFYFKILSKCWVSASSNDKYSLGDASLDGGCSHNARCLPCPLVPRCPLNPIRPLLPSFFPCPSSLLPRPCCPPAVLLDPPQWKL